jgi:hypothetical protein
VLRPASTTRPVWKPFGIHHFWCPAFFQQAPKILGTPHHLWRYGVALVAGVLILFNFAKGDLLLLWWVALVVAAALMALTATSALDRLSAGYTAQSEEPKLSSPVR